MLSADFSVFMGESQRVGRAERTLRRGMGNF